MSYMLGGPTGSDLENYPSQLTLPDPVHIKTLDAVSQTDVDNRERSVGFRYQHGKWNPGKMKVGRSLTLNPDGSINNAGTGRVLRIHRPHLYMHTHPSVDPNLTEQSVRLFAKSKGLDDEAWIDLRTNVELQYNHGTHMLPSLDDVRNTYWRSLGSIGNIIASTGGIFLYLRNNLDQEETLIPPEHNEAMIKTLEEYRANQFTPLNENLSTPATRTFVLKAVARALGHRYFCYFGENPENPTLEKISE